MFGRYKVTPDTTTRQSDRMHNSKARRARGRKTNRPNHRLAIEQFEPKQMLTTFTVTSDLDTGAVGELRWAINSANAVVGPDTIEFDGTVSHINLTMGELLITDDLTIGDSATDPLSIAIDAGGNSRIFRVNDGNPANDITVSMAHLDLQNGNVTSTAGQGGAVLNTEELAIFNSTVTSSRAVVGGGLANFGSLTINSVRVAGNSALNGGGGIWNSANGVAIVEGGSIVDNQVEMGPGGGILNDGGRLGVFPTSEVSSNGASANGGGIAVQNGGIAHIEGTTISGNRGFTGGGLSAVGPGTTLVSQNNTVSDNDANRGGGFAFNDGASGSVRRNLISSNSARIGGGGGYVSGNAEVDMVNSEVVSNEAGTDASPGTGAGLAVGNASLFVDQSNIAFNGIGVASSNVTAGGGIFADNGANLAVENSSISGNVARTGAGIYASRIDDTQPVSTPRTTVSVSDTQLFENNSEGDGGGIFVGPGTDLRLKCVDLTDNSALLGSGGGLKLVGSSGVFNVEAEILDSTFTGNRALTNGGGISSQGAVGMRINNTIVNQNFSSALGGGLYLAGTDALPVNVNSTQITASLVSGNEAGQDPGIGSGGGIFVGEFTSTTVDTTTVSRNSAVSIGGGISVNGSRSFTLKDSTVSGNRSNRGGGLALIESRALVSQDTFYGNVANVHGGGIFVQSSGTQSHVVDHTTISGNRAGASGQGRGGGIYISNAAGSSFTVDLSNSIVSDNNGVTASSFDEIFDQSSSTSAGMLNSQFSLIRNNNGIALPAGNPDPSGNLIGTASSPISAELGPLADNGGPTLTMAPMDSSPAIDSGDPLMISPPGGDQRQLPYKRIFNAVVDMGAVEIQPPPPTPDFDGDGDADLNDIDALVADIAAGTNTPTFDLTGDGSVNQSDLRKWLDDAPDVNGIPVKHYLPADANLDLVVDVTDFNIWNANKFTAAAAWSKGDFNADGFVDASDFNIWNANKFTVSPPLCDCGLSGLAQAAGSEHIDSVFDMDNESQPARELHDYAFQSPVMSRFTSVKSMTDSASESDKDDDQREHLQVAPLDQALAEW